MYYVDNMEDRFESVNISDINTSIGLFPEYVNNKPVDLEKICMEDGLKNDFVQMHKNKNLYNQLWNIENINDYKEFVKTKSELWENSVEAVYYVYNSYDFIGYCVIKNIDWNLSCCDIKLYIPPEKLSFMDNIIDSALCVVFYKLGLNVVNLAVSDENAKEGIEEYTDELESNSGNRKIYVDGEYKEEDVYTIKAETI